MEAELFGMAGLACILIAWTPGIIDTIKTKEPGMKKRFIALYFIGSALLAYYSYTLNSLPFMILNAAAAIVPLIHLYYYIAKHGHKKLFVPT